VPHEIGDPSQLVSLQGDHPLVVVQREQATVLDRKTGHIVYRIWPGAAVPAFPMLADATPFAARGAVTSSSSVILNVTVCAKACDFTASPADGLLVPVRHAPLLMYRYDHIYY
jgi:hypothetical protein